MSVMQMGDATNMVLILGGELLKKAENLLIMGLVPSEVIKGYELASAKAQAELESGYNFNAITAQFWLTVVQNSQHLAYLHR